MCVFRGVMEVGGEQEREGADKVRPNASSRDSTVLSH